MSKYKTGDKVVICKDLIDGKEYGENDWAEDMKYLADNDYVVLGDTDFSGYEVDGWEITDEMIEGLYEEEEIKKEHETYKQALGSIAFHINEPLGEPENYKDTVYEFIDIAKRALGL